MLKGNTPSAMVSYLLDYKKISAESIAEKLSKDSGKDLHPRQIIQIIIGHYSVKKWLFAPLLKCALENGWLPDTMYDFEIVHVKLFGYRIPMHEMDTHQLFEAIQNIAPINEQQLAEKFKKCANEWRMLKNDLATQEAS